MAKQMRALPAIDPSKPHTLHISAILKRAAQKVLADHAVEIPQAKLRRLTTVARQRRPEIMEAIQRDNLTYDTLIGTTAYKLHREHIDPRVCVPTPVNPCL